MKDRLGAGQIADEIANMPEQELYVKLKGFVGSTYIFDENSKELIIFLQKLINDPNAPHLMSPRNRHQLDNVFRHTLRLIHNFVASAASLIDHTRRFHNKMYAEHGLFEDYQSRVDEVFKNDSLSQFVKCLRQYCLHYETPAIGFTVEVTPSGDKNEHLEKISINLFVNELRKYDNWNREAKHFLNESLSLDKKQKRRFEDLPKPPVSRRLKACQPKIYLLPNSLTK